MTREFACIICVCVSFALTSLSKAQHDQLAVKVELSKHQYLKCEPIFATFSFINTGVTPIAVLKHLNIIVKDSNGKSYPDWYDSIATRDSWDETFTLAPHDTLSFIVDLLTTYAHGRRQLRYIHTRTFYEPGFYTIQATSEANEAVIPS